MALITTGDSGNSASTASIPIADATGAVIDSTTYTNPITGSGKIATVVFPQTTTAFAFALTGDAFPRWCFSSDPVNDDITLADGTINPDGGNGAFIGVTAKQADGTIPLNLGGGGGGVVLGLIRATTQYGHANVSNLPIQFGGSLAISAGAGDPNTLQIPGTLGDLYFRSDPGGALETIYRCTTTGASSVAVWTGIV